jgi:hypothetical protein
MSAMQGVGAFIAIAIVGFVALIFFAVESIDDGRDV